MLRFAIFAMTILASSTAWGWQSPKEAIEQFISYELSGGRLTGSNWSTYTTQYIAAPKNYDEPGWDEVTVVKSWRISSLVCPSKSRCTARVSYILSPTAHLSDQNVVPHPTGGEETLSYNLIKNNRGWFLAPEISSPRILEATYRNFRKS